jgi:hypothetical protein
MNTNPERSCSSRWFGASPFSTQSTSTLGMSTFDRRAGTDMVDPRCRVEPCELHCAARVISSAPVPVSPAPHSVPSPGALIARSYYPVGRKAHTAEIALCRGQYWGQPRSTHRPSAKRGWQPGRLDEAQEVRVRWRTTDRIPRLRFRSKLYRVREFQRACSKFLRAV